MIPIEHIILKYPHAKYVSFAQEKIILTSLCSVLQSQIEGDVIEMGCFAGDRSILIREVLDAYHSEKKFHLFDSFKGLPQKSKNDFSKKRKAKKFNQGSFCSNIDIIVQKFNEQHLTIPEFHIGWFAEISDDEYPSQISFAFLDSDLYGSIIDSFVKIWHKITINGIVCVHDYNRKILPGVTKACSQFLADKKYKTISTEQNVLVIQKLG